VTVLDVALACDIMTDLEGPIRPAIYLATEMVAMGHKVSIISPVISDDVEKRLLADGMTPINLHSKLIARNSAISLLWFEAWAREAFLKLNSKGVNRHSNLTVNFSHTLVVPSTFWYLQGPTSSALKDMEGELTIAYRFVYEILRPLIGYVDGKLVKDIDRNSTFIVANSRFCASLYEKWGIVADDIIYPPIDCKVFQPLTSNPSSDYVLTYFGKESKFSIVKAVADLGVKIRAFGSKAPFVPKSVINHPNIELLGRISTEELVNIYSNALFTLFPFTHEPFGYIPVESMACGTPTLTFDSQGPGESVTDGYTGWLARSDGEFITIALRLWKQGYASAVRRGCTKAASMFDKKLYVKKWLKVMEARKQEV